MMNSLPIRKVANAPVLPPVAFKSANAPVVLPTLKTATNTNTNTNKPVCLGTLTVNGKETKITASLHADERMDERQVRKFQTIMSACGLVNLDKFDPAAEVMVNVTNAGLSFVLGFRAVRMGMIQIQTVIDKAYAVPSWKRPNTLLEQVAI